jgi:hypothetical protein
MASSPHDVGPPLSRAGGASGASFRRACPWTVPDARAPRPGAPRAAATELARAKASAAVESRAAEALLSKGPLHTTAADERELLAKAKKSVRFAEDVRMITASSALLERVKQLDKVQVFLLRACLKSTPSYTCCGALSD